MSLTYYDRLPWCCTDSQCGCTNNGSNSILCGLALQFLIQSFATVLAALMISTLLLVFLDAPEGKQNCLHVGLHLKKLFINMMFISSFLLDSIYMDYRIIKKSVEFLLPNF